jgi:hypothetical protein
MNEKKLIKSLFSEKRKFLSAFIYIAVCAVMASVYTLLLFFDDPKERL